MRVGVPQRTMGRLKNLEALLAPHHLVRGRMACRSDPQLDALLAWGNKPSGTWARQEAKRRQLQLWRCEDGFLRSVGSGKSHPPLGLVVDRVGIYYDPSQPSDLDQLIQQQLTQEQLIRSKALVRRWRQARLSKYNNAHEAVAPAQPFVLVVDQCYGDLSLSRAKGTSEAFAMALEAAISQNPGHLVVVKIHPDVVAGQRRGHFKPEQLQDSRVVVSADGGHPTGLLEQAEAVYVVTSQLGFEALIWDKPVHCYGQPFYAAWGLTNDACLAPAWRRKTVPLEQLVHASLISYSRYCNPVLDEPAEVEQLIDHLALQRQQMLRMPALLVACGITPWKRTAARRFLRGPKGSRLLFRGQSSQRFPEFATAVVWGRPKLQPHRPCWQLEDGFLRSVGLGAQLVQPTSWVLDREGIYYDATSPSDLEVFLANHLFTPQEKQRGRLLREQLLAAGLTKYNLAATAWSRPPTAQGRMVRLVVGQVPNDASLRLGVPTSSPVRSNRQLLEAVRRSYPDDYLLYKPHPDLVADLRQGSHKERKIAALADEILLSGDMAQLMETVDCLHVLTSLSGFEALLREKPVQVFGQPFYAGWGLTEDLLACKRRGRRLELDELVYGALIHYPAYICQRSGDWITAEQAVDQLAALKQQPNQLTIEQLLWRLWKSFLVRTAALVQRD